MDLQRELQRVAEAGTGQEAGGTPARIAGALIRRPYSGEDDRRVWKQLRTIAKRELPRDIGDGNHDVDLPVPILLPNVVAQRNRRLLLWKAVGFQILREEIDVF